MDGQIQRQTFPGPPNYTSIKEGDKRDVQWILHLSTPACINGKRDWNRYRPLLGKKVRVTGTLYHGFSAHHRTQVLLQVRLIEALPSSPRK